MKNIGFKSILIKLIVIICAIALFVVVAILTKDYLESRENEKAIDELIDMAVDEDDETDELKIDWNYLKSVNSDIIGWLKIENTSIDYPILQDTSSLYYLKHNYKKEYNSNGSLFTIDEYPFGIEETTIYGHNMKNGTMFSTLDQYYLDEDFFYSHLNIKIYTPEKKYDGIIFSVYSINFSTETNNIKNLELYERIRYYKESSVYETDYEETISKIVKLTTCSYINNHSSSTNQRYYIIAALYSN